MRLTCLAALPLLLVAAPAAAATRDYSVTGFSRIRVDGPYSVTLKVGPGASARATGDMRAIDALNVEVRGDTLVVGANASGGWGGWAGESHGKVTVAVTTPSLRSAVMNGSGTLGIDRAKAMRFDAVVGGAGSLTLGDVSTDRLSLTAVGSGRLVVGGHAAIAQATLQGSGAIEAAGLTAEALDLTASGPGNARFAATKTAKVTATGSGEVTVTGPAVCTVNSIGSGEVRCGKSAAAAP